MVDFSDRKNDNIVDFSARLDDRMAKTIGLSDEDRSPFTRPAYEYITDDTKRGRAWALMGFRQQSLGHEDKVILQIIGMSIMITGLIMGLAFGVGTAIVGLSRIF